MRYDPIMCMMVDDSVKTKDETFIIEAKKEGRPYKAIVNGEEKEVVKYYTHKGFTDIKLTKTKGKDSNTIDKAIRSCDEEQFYQIRFGSGKIEGIKGDIDFVKQYVKDLMKKYGEKSAYVSQKGKSVFSYVNI